MSQAITPAGDVDDRGVLQESVEDRGGRRHVADEFGPILQGTVAGHHRRAVLVAAHDDLQQAFPRSLWKLFHPHVVDDQQIGLEVTVERLVLLTQFLIP